MPASKQMYTFWYYGCLLSSPSKKKKAHFRPCFNIPNGISGNFINRQVKNLELDLLEKVKANIGFKFFKGFLSDPQV